MARTTASVVDRMLRALPKEYRTDTVKARDEHINLKTLVPGGSKTRLAEELWPVLERRTVGAIGKKSEKRIPVFRVLDEAIELAYELSPRYRRRTNRGSQQRSYREAKRRGRSRCPRTDAGKRQSGPRDARLGLAGPVTRRSGPASDAVRDPLGRDSWIRRRMDGGRGAP